MVLFLPFFNLPLFAYTLKFFGAFFKICLVTVYVRFSNCTPIRPFCILSLNVSPIRKSIAQSRPKAFIFELCEADFYANLGF